MSIYIFSYTWHKNGQRHFETELTRKHPILVIREWHDELNGNNGSTLLWYHEIGEEQLGDLELQKYIDQTLSSNYGEFSPSRENRNDQ